MIKRLLSLAWLLAIVVGAWQLARYSGVPAFLLPSPAAVGQALLQQHVLLIHHASYTLGEIALALLLGGGAGVTLAIAMAASPLLRRLLFPLVAASQTIPVFALAPLLVLWLGFGVASKVAVAALIVFFPLCLSLFDGLCRTPPGWLELAQTMNRSRLRLFLHVRWPAALPHFFSGLQMAAILAPVGVVIGEWVGASEGLGYLMMHASARLETPLSFAALALLMLLALLLSGGVALLRRRFLYSA
ncbi:MULTISPECIES: ABC transporter permease [Pantoea]|uniref:ABC transporter permease n=1 Tax=Pantoea TaxID=53335 RepID=UPI0005353957|nr:MULTISPECIES: ABC transporter permease subunit [Pantoea]MBS6435722.1 ABC transporter permease subunit [Pantoea sp.]MDU2727348.1 ABC transporter permease subunit [Pantoea sp.]MDU6079583.1 ABC transporter permease subunit [Pantoea sp.]MDU6389520.1 ABC transporter permease subunit [Pantoea sp.]MDU7838972.1 ABC transporter permease subunit [Pantoea sp.]